MRKSKRRSRENATWADSVAVLAVTVLALLAFLWMRNGLAVTISAQGTDAGLGYILNCLLVAPAIWVAVYGLLYLYKRHRKRALRRKLDELSEQSGRLPVREFLRNRSLLMADGDFTGVYVIYNEDQDLYYVGQSVHVLKRLGQHFSGNGGNGDVYADFRAGDDFTVTAISLARSGYDNLNRLERDTISAYDAYEKGYNRVRGNRD